MDFHFLIASERSGSNLITKMMDAHPDVCGPSPLHFIRILGTELFRFGNIQHSKNWRSLLKVLLEMLQSDFAVWQANYNLEALEGMAEVGDLPALLQAVLTKEAKANGKQVVFFKELFVYDFLPFLQWCFPNAKYIYLVRDARDMALSWRKSKPHPGGIIMGAKNWLKDQSKTVPLFAALEAAGRGTLVRYEDLTSTPEKELQKICDHIGIDYREQMLQFHENGLTKDNAGKSELWKNLSKEVLSNNSGKFLKALHPREIQMIEKLCGPYLNYFGYRLVTKEQNRVKITNQMIDAFNIEERSKYKPEPVRRVHDIVQRKLRNGSVAGLRFPA